ncbi:SGNH/GDSL hydrolase family protein [Parabacteroides sp. OttesenSCG-928-N08]|nr:SGNH/GDSL hydrolase family protein [Parabacteroides sp. OttesenSCG-928-N08]
MKAKTVLFAALLLCHIAAQAQQTWYNPIEAGFPTIQNQGWTEEIGNPFARLPERAQQQVRPPLWELSRNSAGLSLSFYSNAPTITVRYGVTGGFNMPHMPTLGVSGIDLYARNSDGAWSYCAPHYAFGDTIRYTFTITERDRYHQRGFEYRLFLPLYNSVEWMEIGVPESAELSFIPLSLEKPILLYGTSVTQGGCASRPAMAWGNILQRAIDLPVINLGFSGNGRLEPELLDLITEIDARLYLLDCLANLGGRNEEELVELIRHAVHRIRAKRTAPILLMEHAGLSDVATHRHHKEELERVNRANKTAYNLLIEEGIDQLYYLTHEEIALPEEGCVDGVHPTDLGMQAIADAVENRLRETLKMPAGELPTTRAVTQRREPDNYEWLHRHRYLLQANRENPPRAVIFGNSITHFWGDETNGPVKRGADSWDDKMRPAGFRNMGYGWDRIENLFWRIYHDELEGYEAEQVVVMIGTNNIEHHTKEEILQGLRQLYALIRDRQPHAAINVVGILPRRGAEEYVNELNRGIREITIADGYQFVNPGRALLTAEGTIDESLFSDGLHPNEKGYRLIVGEIAE